ncbi:MAG: hypothetical protein A3D35_02425 [Candidatus Staskawiczbacteria bacterium RIFCSPHIGHO2_02_FULL_34_9]|uniref:Methyltransferase type 11 domain-containing protein n=1 Tax=Candidatus Staskawiczbacteria bacterium RIFCSPHIGHO2_02_FULL_34_9 TaxID=1802206 RepID=A0A1G2HZG0_9BACT|nr:MAG: hypothetical protein A3D35_02425 [Candidatus Staskawiczbacteria bacterium RIFCSPHIGHO2_02_FULL_34_9]
MIKKDLQKYGQYKGDIFHKLDFNFEAGKKILDVGCGDGGDAEIFIKEFDLHVFSIDVYRHKNINNLKELTFKEATIYSIPFDNNTFDYIFLHDILHHIDEKEQLYEKQVKGLRELNRVLCPGGSIIIVEGNRYNPLFYPHMVLFRGHQHWKQSYFIKIIKDVFSKKEYNIQFKFFESHLYPGKFIILWKLYETLMEKFMPRAFLSYNVAIITKNK